MGRVRPPPARRKPAAIRRRARASSVTSHTGRELRDMFAAATAWLEVNADAINSINVFPVPDGDTGSNMYHTMRSTMDEASHVRRDDAGAVAGAMAHGALMGARGNSGVILSQILRGMAEGLSGKERFTAADFARALDVASRSAYSAVTEPLEGTILTVMREAAVAVNGKGKRPRRMARLLTTAVHAAREAVDRTPAMLPALREAGVVDAGGQGLCVLLDGALHYVQGDLGSVPPPAPREAGDRRLELAASAHDAHGAQYGYCTEFLVQGERLDREDIQRRMLSLGEGVLVAGDGPLLRVHVHTPDPGAVISFGTSLGRLDNVKVDNIQTQADRFAGRMRAPSGEPAPPIGVVVVAAGPGLAEAAYSLGASAVVQGGQSMNPSMASILSAVESCPSPEVIILPNNKNVVLAANQAARHARKKAVVVPTTTFPQGIAAILALNPEAGLDESISAMEAARRSVRTAEVTRAVRTTTVNGVRIRRGQAIGLVDGELRVAEDSVPAAVRASLDRCLTPASSLVTLYYGADVPAAEAAALKDALSAEHPSLDLELVPGGQPHYHYIVSVE